MISRTCLFFFFPRLVYDTNSLSLRWSSDAFAMASHNCCFSGGLRHNVSCVHAELREGSRRLQHATESGKNIPSVLWRFWVTTRKWCLTGKSSPLEYESLHTWSCCLVTHPLNKYLKANIVFAVSHDTFSDDKCTLVICLIHFSLW